MGKTKEKKTFSGVTGNGEGWENGGVPPEKVWWPPVLSIFYWAVAVSITMDSVIQNISFIIKTAQTNFI